MANLELTIKNGAFTGASGAVKSFSPTRVISMGWLVQIYEDGTLDAICQKKSEEGKFSLKAMMKNGLLIVTKRITLENGTYKNLGKYERKIGSGEINGVLGLSTEKDVEERYVYFKDEEEIKFKKAYFIKKIEYIDPNQVYSVHIDASVYTDGKCRKTVTGKETCLIEVEDATWVLIDVPTENKERLLYTVEEYNNISLPKILSSAGRAEIVRSLKKEFSSVEEALEYTATLNLFKKSVYAMEEDYGSDDFKVNASYYLDADGILKVSISKVFIWKSRESFELSSIDENFVKEDKDYFSITGRVLEGLAYYIEK